jgi:ComF family protein
MKYYPVLRALAKRTTELFHGFLHLLYPKLCVACQYELPAAEFCFCIRCQLKLQPTRMHLEPKNEFTDRFFGRVPILFGAAAFYFNRKNPIQKALHQLKYHNQPDIGVQLGRHYGKIIKQHPPPIPFDLVIPVPLHPKREHQRGYNQSTLIAQGLAEELNLHIVEKNLRRNTHTQSQTKKGRNERFANMQAAFVLRNPDALQHKHILLVDDMLTTGATLEACALVLSTVKNTRVSMITIAIAAT